jgi:uncharacterized membrane protein
MQDLRKRSIAKGISWRIFATLDTYIISYLFFQKMYIAASIAITEIFTKILLYYIHERGWNSISWGRKENIPTHLRSLLKGITWRILGSTDTFLLSLFYSKILITSLHIGLSEIFTKIILFYLHERIWSHIKWGRIFDKPSAQIYQPKIKSL